MSKFLPPLASSRLSVAPMMDVTDRYFRTFIRLLSRRCLLYTEMIVDNTIAHAHKEGRLGKYLDFDPFEKPLIAQLGGSDKKSLFEAAKILEDYGYDGINLNVGCPSDRVQTGSFGACLMKEPALVADCLVSIQSAVSLPVSVKHRIGVDEFDSEEYLHKFVQILSDAGVRHFIVHARKAWLKGLSPSENRKIPPLRRDVVHRLKQAFPHLFIETNGEIKSLTTAIQELQLVDGVMIGRAAQDNPWLFSQVDPLIFGQPAPFESRLDVLPHLQEICLKLLSSGKRQHQILRHILGLFHAEPGAKVFRRFITEECHKTPNSPDILIRSLELITAEYRRIANTIQQSSEISEV